MRSLGWLGCAQAAPFTRVSAHLTHMHVVQEAAAHSSGTTYDLAGAGYAFHRQLDDKTTQYDNTTQYDDPCGRQCGLSTCGSVNMSFSCEALQDLATCDCRGCCFNEGPKLTPLGSFGLIVLGCWALAMLCFLQYRYFAFRAWRADSGGVQTLQRRQEDNSELDLSEEQWGVRYRAQRYQWSLLNFLCPCVAYCCPATHTFVSGGARTVKKRAKQKVVRGAQLTRQGTKATIRAAELGAVGTATVAYKGATYARSVAKEYNVTGATLHAGLAYKHGNDFTSPHARGVLFNTPDKTPVKPAALTPDQQRARAVSQLSSALVALASGGTADVVGEPEDIELAASQLERAASQVRMRLAAAQGVEFEPLLPPTAPKAFVEQEAELLKVRAELAQLRSELRAQQRPQAAAGSASAAARGSQVAAAAAQEAAAARAQIDELAEEVANEVEAEPTSGAVTEVFRPAFRQSFAASGNSLTEGATPGAGKSTPGHRRNTSRVSFLEVYNRNSVADPESSASAGAHISLDDRLNAMPQSDVTSSGHRASTGHLSPKGVRFAQRALCIANEAPAQGLLSRPPQGLLSRPGRRVRRRMAFYVARRAGLFAVLCHREVGQARRLL